MEHRLLITKIFQIAQFVPKASFRQFGDKVSDAGREGDQDPSKNVLADNMKLIGNCAHCKTVTNEEKRGGLRV